VFIKIFVGADTWVRPCPKPQHQVEESCSGENL
jgi:hypothetical protein